MKLMLLLFLVFNFALYSQKSEVVFKSKIKHDYAVGNQFYLENNVDTNRLLFMGTIKITSSNQDILITNAVSLLKIKTNQLNGNVFKLKSFTKHDTTLNMLFDVYFAPFKQLDINDESKLKAKLYVFNNIKDSLQRRLNINNNNYNFKRTQCLEITPNVEKLEIKIDSAKKNRVQTKN